MGSPTSATSTGTIQISGGGNCSPISVFPTPTAPPGWIAILPGGGVTISGTGSGVFDSSFFPIGFEARDSRGALSGSITINGQVFSGASLYTADVAAALMGQTLSSWSVSIGGGQYQTQGQGAPPMGLTNSFSYCVWLGTNSLCNTGANNSPTNPLFPTNPGGGSSSSSSSSGGSSSSSSGGGGSLEPWVFTQVPSGRWTDPPFVNGFAYTGTGGTLFDKITLPTGYGASFNVYLAGNNLFGTFSAGDVVDFLAGGVSYFEIRGIAPAVDAASPTAFPLQVFFEGGGNGDFTQLGLEAADVPEPATWVMIALAVPVAFWRRRRS